MTPDQVISLYAESRRQEAREILNLYHALSIIKTDKDSRKKAIEALNLDAYPFDPEADGDFDTDDIRALRKIF